jgi:CMP-N-acetylneuraminic acid synthetase
MYKGKRILAIIPARGGSKGLPGKNIKPLWGKPLIGWTIEQAKACSYIDEIFVSTDSKDIADSAERFGISVPSLRPVELASDTSSTADVIDYILELLENPPNNATPKLFDYLLLLEPTSPLRKRDDLKNIIEKVVDTHEADGLITLGEIHMEHPMIVKKVCNEGKIIPYIPETTKISQRQQADKAYFPYGVAYVIKTEIFKKQKTFYTDHVIPYFIDRQQNYEIDDIYDFLCIEAILRENTENFL